MFILNTPSDLEWILPIGILDPKVPPRIVRRSEHTDYFLRFSYGPNRISTPDGRFVPVSVTLEVIGARDDQVVWLTTASRRPGWVVKLPEYPPILTAVWRLREAMGK